MIKNNLKCCKDQLRKKYKLIRSSIDNDYRQALNKKIFLSLINSSFFKSAGTIYAYASLPDEADTISVIEYALSCGKRVAVPYCIPKTPLMDFYYINSLNELKKGSFGVLEPDPNVCMKATDKDALILVPALAFDKNGYRMGYGKGYYDRYLSDYTGVKAGLCFSLCISNCILHNRFDKCVNYIITDKFTKFIAK